MEEGEEEVEEEELKRLPLDGVRYFFEQLHPFFMNNICWCVCVCVCVWHYVLNPVILLPLDSVSSGRQPVPGCRWMPLVALVACERESSGSSSGFLAIKRQSLADVSIHPLESVCSSARN